MSAAAATLLLASNGTAAADEIRTTSGDASYDAATRTFTLHVGESATALLTYYVTSSGHSGCDLTGRDSHLTLGAVSSDAGVLSGLTSPLTYTDCGDEDDPPTLPVGFTAAAPGTTVVTFDVTGFSSNKSTVTPETFERDLASFTVVVLGEGRDAPAVANEFLNHEADESTVAACRAANGTNTNQSNWHGQLIGKIAQFFEGQTFAPEEEYVVVDKVLEYCGVGA